MSLYPLLFQFIKRIDPETAHGMAITALKSGVPLSCPASASNVLSSNVFGLHFKNPVGMAAGFDKNAEAVKGLSQLGFGFVEAGTVTPKPQAGNDKPRMFRLLEDEALINRLGFNNKGLEEFCRNLQTTPGCDVIVGANISKNKDQTDHIADYVTCLKAVYPLADYITVNISSPNTPGLRNLQSSNLLDELVVALLEERKLLAGSNTPKPLLVKIAPDLDESEIQAIADVALKRELDGLIVSNTTISRPEYLKSNHKTEQGGLSGRPLLSISNKILAEVYKATERKTPLIGVGGIFTASDAYAKIKAGASLVQLYTGMVYRGFGIANNINSGLEKLLKADGYNNISEAIGSGIK